MKCVTPVAAQPGTDIGVSSPCATNGKQGFGSSLTATEDTEGFSSKQFEEIGIIHIKVLPTE